MTDAEFYEEKETALVILLIFIIQVLNYWKVFINIC